MLPLLTNPACVFCQEFDGHASSVYHDLLGRELPSRIIRRTPHFLAFPPLGQFVEGGLLLATHEHRVSMAHLPESWYDELERLMQETCEVLLDRYGCRPLMFEHAPAAPGEKGTCCVDHAHLNVFPVRADVHEQLRKFPHASIDAMQELSEPSYRDVPYLFLQTNEGERFVYEAGIVPSQYVRRIVTAAIGMPERWHWREYLGLEELKRTFLALSGWRDRECREQATENTERRQEGE
jgi:diadenosine tetraphosphate (Ap4A) HIT family hydrolase